MKGVIKAPKGIITGAFTILFTFMRPVELTAADVVVETLEGDALGHTKDSFGGSGANYYILCYLPDARKGKSRISVSSGRYNPADPFSRIDSHDFEVAPVVVEYDTVKTVTATWGTPIRRGSSIEVPVIFDTLLQNLKKRNFQLSAPMPFQLYGAGDTYSLVVPRSVTISVSGTARKQNGIQAEIEAATLEVSV